MRQLLTTVFAVLAAISYAAADSMTPRLLQRCHLINQKQRIVCYGGSTGSSDVWNHFNPTSDFFQLNVTAPLTPNQALSSWSPMPASPDFALEARAEFGMEVVNDTRIVIVSGAGPSPAYTQSGLVNVTVYYDTIANQWGHYGQSAFPLNFSYANGTDVMETFSNVFTQLQGVGANVLNMNGSNTITYPIIVNGGMRLDNASFLTTAVTSNYNGIQPMDPQWNTINVWGADSPFGGFGRTFREEAIRSENDRIFFFGGLQFNPTDAYNNYDNSSKAIRFADVFFLDVASGYFNDSWLGLSEVIPNNRYWHTVTLIPGKNEIIMYGGTWGGVACNDYAYTFDTNLMKWKAIVFPQLNDNSCSAPNANCGGPRFGHSAILVKDVLYIMFGADGSRSLQNNVVMLNITSMMWLGADANSTYSAQAANGNGTSSDTSSTGLSGGKIAGVVVGVVAGVALLGAAAFFFLRRNRREEVPEAPAMFNTNNAPGMNDNMSIPSPLSSPTMTNNFTVQSQAADGTIQQSHVVVKPFSSSG